MLSLVLFSIISALASLSADKYFFGDIPSHFMKILYRYLSLIQKVKTHFYLVDAASQMLEFFGNKERADKLVK